MAKDSALPPKATPAASRGNTTSAASRGNTTGAASHGPATDGARNPYGPRPLGALIPALTRPAFKRKSPAGAALLADWPSLVGPALAAMTSPKRFSAGTLTIGCAGPVAMELTHLAPQLIARINGQLGRTLVERLRFVQQPGIRPTAPPVPPAPVQPLPDHVATAVAALPAGELREALAKLAAGVYRGRR